jgi:hypothetical protein
MASYRMYFGRNIPLHRIYNTLPNSDKLVPTDVQLSVSIKEFERYINSVPFIQGYTMLHGTAMYKNDANVLEIEDTTVVDVFGIDDLQVIQIVTDYKVKYFQEGVLYRPLPSNTFLV